MGKKLRGWLPAVFMVHLTFAWVELSVGSTNHFLGRFGALDFLAIFGSLAVLKWGRNHVLTASFLPHLAIWPAKVKLFDLSFKSGCYPTIQDFLLFFVLFKMCEVRALSKKKERKKRNKRAVLNCTLSFLEINVFSLRVYLVSSRRSLDENSAH